MFQAVCGCLSTKRIFTIDLMPLNPYFQGIHQPHGAPFWFGQRLAVETRRPAGSADAWPRPCGAPRCRASRAPESTAPCWPGICLGSNSVVNSTYLALAVGSTCLISPTSGKPTQGITIDHASTQRSDRRAPRRRQRRRSSMSKSSACSPAPSTSTVQGRVLSVPAQTRRVILVRAELVEVVVAGDVLHRTPVGASSRLVARGCGWP